MNIKAVIFDMDGLLIDSEPIWWKAYEVLCEKHKVIPSERVAAACHGMGLRECIEEYKKRLGMKGDTIKLLKEFRDIFYRLALSGDNLKLLDGVRGFLMIHRNNQLAVATGGHTSKMAFELLKKSKIDSFFEKVISSDDVKKGKPDPDVYIETARQLGVSPKECLILEDAPNGVLAGKAAGMTVYGVSKDGEMRKRLKEAGADEVFKSLTEITY